MSKMKLSQKQITFIDNYRIYFMFAIILIFMCLFAPQFVGLRNFTNILKSTCLNGVAAIGFTIVLICRELDLSVASSISLGAILVMGMRVSLDAFDPFVAYSVGVLVAIGAGAMVGLVNGLLVTKAKINSFIVTLGTMTAIGGFSTTVTGGIILMYSDYSISVSSEADFVVADFLGDPLISAMQLITPRILITIMFFIIFGLLLTRTRIGRNFYVVGGNRDSAWLAGINTDTYVTSAYIISGILAATSGALFAMENNAATTYIGGNSLMVIVGAVIIGGTSMAGGKGGVFKTGMAILMLETLFNGMNRFKIGTEFKIFANGIIMAAVILYEAYALYKNERTRGQRPELLKGG